MSKSLTFYRIRRVADDLPEIINTDDVDFPYDYTMADRAEEWERSLGILRTIEYARADVDEASEELFGERPTSATYTWHYLTEPNDELAEVICHFGGGRHSERISRAELNRFIRTKRYEAYVYDSEELGYIEEDYLFDYRSFEDRVLQREDILGIAKRFMDEHGEDGGEYYAKPFYTLMSVYFKSDDGDSIVCIAG